MGKTLYLADVFACIGEDCTWADIVKPVEVVKETKRTVTVRIPNPNNPNMPYYDRRFSKPHPELRQSEGEARHRILEWLHEMRNMHLKNQLKPDTILQRLQAETDPKWWSSTGHVLRVILAEEHRADGDDDSCYVIAILTEEDSDQEAWQVADKVASSLNAKTLAMHDGTASYRVVDTRKK